MLESLERYLASNTMEEKFNGNMKPFFSVGMVLYSLPG